MCNFDEVLKLEIIFYQNFSNLSSDFCLFLQLANELDETRISDFVHDCSHFAFETTMFSKLVADVLS